MTGVPSTGLPIGAFNTAFACLGVMLFCIFLSVSYFIGVSNGAIWSLEKVQHECTKHDDRSFVSTGNWLIHGSGEITVHSVCVEWIVRR